MPYFFYEGVYLGLVAIHDQKSDRVWTELAWSPDTINWTRIDVGNPLIPNSEIKLDYESVELWKRMSQNKKGKEIAISKTIKKTSMNQIVQFDRKITENNISLKFTINDAKLYSFLIGK